jgi:hypothetical protein
MFLTRKVLIQYQYWKNQSDKKHKWKKTRHIYKIQDKCLNSIQMFAGEPKPQKFWQMCDFC